MRRLTEENQRLTKSLSCAKQWSQSFAETADVLHDHLEQFIPDEDLDEFIAGMRDPFYVLVDENRSLKSELSILRAGVEAVESASHARGCRYEITRPGYMGQDRVGQCNCIKEAMRSAMESVREKKDGR